MVQYPDMSLLRLFAFAIGLAPLIVRAQGNLEITPRDLILLEQLGSQGFIPAAWTANMQAMFYYINDVWPWVIGIATGIAVLQVLVSGVQIMFSGSSEKAAEGKSRLFWAIAGLLLAAFAGFILKTLNSLFYQ